ncbi:MAG: hypothetical protein RR902_06280, partial [Oscillospiraceae bacterium]
KAKSLTQIINEEYLPEALSCGVDYNLFWTLNPRKLKAFIKAQEKINKRKNYELWLQGAYFYNAMSIAISNVFAKNDTDRQTYMQCPIGEEIETEQPTAEQIAENERLKALVWQINLKHTYEKG